MYMTLPKMVCTLVNLVPIHRQFATWITLPQRFFLFAPPPIPSKNHFPRNSGFDSYLNLLLKILISFWDGYEYLLEPQLTSKELTVM